MFLFGIFCAMFGVLASPEKLHSNNAFLNFLLNIVLVTVSDEIKGLLKFMGIAFSSLAGLWAYLVQKAQ